MIIRSVELSDFRNYETLSLNFDRGTNILYGDNAQGKTNILEAVFLSCTTKSHKGAKDREMIRFGKNEAHIRTCVEKNGMEMRVDMHLRASRAKGVAVDGVRMKKASDFLNRLSARLIFFSPEDLDVIKGAPSGRRRFMDMELCQADRVYMEALSRYQKALSERAAFLKEMKPGSDETLLDVYDGVLIENGKKIIAGRKQFAADITEIAGRTHRTLTGDRETLFLSYEASCGEADFEDVFRRFRKKDILTKQTNTGPHRDDLKLLIKRDNDQEAQDVRRYGSQGQQRTVALTLKLSEIELVRSQGLTQPVLLLDDVLSELDEERQNRLLSAIGDIQTIITCTGLDGFVDGRLTINKILKVTNGTVTAEN